jgi:hypothetical protein
MDGMVIYSHPMKFFLLFNRQVFATINALSQSYIRVKPQAGPILLKSRFDL